MASRVQADKHVPETKTEVEEVEPHVPENAQELKDELDDILDEIDSVLEVNAAEFVSNYIQKGGQ